MGNQLAEQRQFKQLEFYTQIDHKTFGMSNIYSSNKFPSCFVLRYTEAVKDIPTLQQLTKIQNQQNIYLLGLYGFRIGKDCDCSMKGIVSDSVTFYWQYLSFSLRDLIEERRKNRLQFQQSEIWHIIKACISGYRTFNNVKCCYDFMPSKLMINSLGRIRLDWMHIESKNNHWNFLKRISLQDNQPLHRQQYFSPEELQALFQKQFTTKIDIEKVNIFSLGISLLECLSGLNPPQYFYAKFSINYQIIQAILSKLTAYSQNLKILIGQMLRKDSKTRPSFQWIKINYSQFMDSQQSILIPKNEENIKRNLKPNSVQFYNSKLKDHQGNRNMNIKE